MASNNITRRSFLGAAGIAASTLAACGGASEGGGDAAAGKVSVYCDGQFVAEKTVNTRGTNHSDQSLSIGVCPSTGRSSDAEFASVRVYSKALSAAELASQNTASPAYSAADPAVALWIDFSQQPEAPDVPSVSLLGDVDVSNDVDVSDAVLLARFLVGDNVNVTDQGQINGDADESGDLSTNDVLTIVRMIAGFHD